MNRVLIFLLDFGNLVNNVVNIRDGDKSWGRVIKGGFLVFMMEALIKGLVDPSHTVAIS